MRSQPFPLLWGLQVHLEGRTNSNTSYINEQVPHSSSQRCYSSKGTSTLGKGGPKESQASQPWYSKFKQALFPVDDAPVEEGPHTKQPMQKPHARSPAMLQYQQYQQQQQQRGPGSTPARAPALTPQAKAERLTGNLFKASLLCISLPLAGGVQASPCHLDSSACMFWMQLCFKHLSKDARSKLHVRGCRRVVCVRAWWPTCSPPSLLQLMWCWCTWSSTR